ncbi:FtsK/SpoIIIE domain-containing protein [Microbacterium sp. BK668]|uniref:FtsK/SpoIIIE domain-containing protein n=1 Tax=Microbacterium sp. BK668 TaxID=2512118 RepID=UPI0010620FA7|nr:FtsK/SpoIIIE domain-containing protein [Microbacterium sp. BK668]TDN88538.1 S-DNA-T family DNA segregation ATPase FtsK/SpoIIIE [Microbacterium sp. BK668]
MASFASLLDPAFDPLDEPLTLPAEPSAPRRPSVPIIATAVPVAGAVGLWLLTGSVLSLWFALLGPLIAGATLLDGLRTARRERRRTAHETDAARARVAASVDARHERERERRRSRHPDVAGYVARESEVWRAAPGRSESLVVGHGDAPSGLHVAGGGSDPASVALRRRALVLAGAPVPVPVAGGIAVVGPPVLASAVSRALVLQACLATPPGELRIVGTPAPVDAWVEALPHRRATTGRALALVGEGEPVPVGADTYIARAAPGGPLPPGCGTVLQIDAPGRARVDSVGKAHVVAIEGVSDAQARHLAAQLAMLARDLPGADSPPTEPVLLAPLLSDPPSDGLAVVIGVEAGAPAVVDLVADGPHAVVAGMTGSGKSELLVTWVLALCATRSPREVSFLLADFKGGTAFDALAALPHVTGVITDLDGDGARRAIQSLRAEVRWREGELAKAGARDILDARVDLPRLVVVVDEFAALLGDHPELHAVFTDIAARGRALGMHLVLGTQRVSGVVRDALLANCPLRISLRVADPADSRAVVGTEEAAHLAGGDGAKGVALIRGSVDAAPRRVRIALSSAADLARIVAESDPHRPRRPWLPDLPRRIDLADLLRHAPNAEIVLGLADEPDAQRQVPVELRREDRGVLVVGSAGTGKTTALRTIAAQARDAIVIPPDPERAWDLVGALTEEPPARGTVIVIDDLDALAVRFPHEYGLELCERLERLARGAGDHGHLMVASAQRLAGASLRIADLLPRRVVLGASSRAEYLALGGESAHFSHDQPRGRARIDGRAVQIAQAPPVAEPSEPEQRAWRPVEGITGFAARRSAAARAMLGAWESEGAHIMTVGQAAALGLPQLAGRAGRTVIVGDGEDWQRQWQLLSAVRDEHRLVIDPSVSPDFRALSADRALPPYCAPGRARAWLCRDGLPPERIVLPPADGAGAGTAREG